MIKEYTKQVMHSAIAHHLPTDAQLVPEQRTATPRPTPPGFIVQHDVPWYGIFVWPVWDSCPSHVPSQLLVPHQPSCWLGMRS